MKPDYMAAISRPKPDHTTREPGMMVEVPMMPVPGGPPTGKLVTGPPPE